MAKYETVSVKIPVELKEKAKKLGIHTGELIRKSLEAEIERREIARACVSRGYVHVLRASSPRLGLVLR